MNAAITCGYQGKVGAVIHGGEYFILSPNMDYIPEPAVNARMSFKHDSRMGDDDPLLWPQPYIKELCYYPCISRNQSGLPRTETHAILYKTYHSDYFVPIATGTLSGLGTLSSDIIAQFRASLESCKFMHQKNEDDPNCVKTALGAQYIISAQLGLRHFEKLPMSKKQQKFVFAQHQRSMLEFLAMIRYISTHMHRINSPVPDREVVDHPEDTVGAFFFDPTVADHYWKAGIPVWLVCPAQKAGSLRVDQLVETIKGRDMVVVEDDPMDHHGVFYSGSPHSGKKYHFFNEYTRHYFSRSNPFRVPTTGYSFGTLEKQPGSSTSTQPSILSAPVASTSAHGAVRPGKSKALKQRKPCKWNLSHLATCLTIIVDEKPGSKPSIGSSEILKFADIAGPLAPPPIDSWSTALLAVDTAVTNRVPHFMDANNGYAFPHPSLFINIQTDERRTLFFINWLKHRSALIYRISAPRTDTSPIGNQMWRTLLGLPLERLSSEEALARETKSAKCKQAIGDILASCINAADGISINLNDDNKISWQGNEITPGKAVAPETSQQILWELSELNFRCELVGLDRRLHDNQLSANQPATLGPHVPLPALWTREDLLGRCFIGTSMLDIELGHANHGLACPQWTDRRRYLFALRNVMITWSGFQSYASSKNLLAFLEPPVLSSDMTENQTHHLEMLVSGFYTQSFFNCFGRAPILPRRL